MHSAGISHANRDGFSCCCHHAPTLRTYECKRANTCLTAQVAPGEALLIIEAMKMEHVIRAPVGGGTQGRVVASLPVVVGEFVEDGRVLCTFEPAAAPPRDGQRQTST